MCFIFKKHFLLRQNLIFLTTFQAKEKKLDSVIDLTKEGLSHCNTGKGFVFFKKEGRVTTQNTFDPFMKFFCVC